MAVNAHQVRFRNADCRFRIDRSIAFITKLSTHIVFQSAFRNLKSAIEFAPVLQLLKFLIPVPQIDSNFHFSE
jgi:hypothetical protein